ncbi:hypothetical protein AX14_004165 [Amanita brunnescens Koide BX004]|nr:hypothetical protein AX14_004165 [Amanita brunnescens Koide BX004]
MLHPSHFHITSGFDRKESVTTFFLLQNFMTKKISCHCQQKVGDTAFHSNHPPHYTIPKADVSRYSARHTHHILTYDQQSEVCGIAHFLGSPSHLIL